MAQELERKFELKPELIPVGHLVPQFIKQGYLMLVGKKQLRVRLVNNKEAFICFKSPASADGIKRNEFEFSIPFNEGEELYALAEHSLEKVRYSFQFNNLHCDCDYYPSGLKIVELEYQEGDEVVIPEFCGAELTDKKEFSNINMAINGTWKIAAE